MLLLQYLGDKTRWESIKECLDKKQAAKNPTQSATDIKWVTAMQECNPLA